MSPDPDPDPEPASAGAPAGAPAGAATGASVAAPAATVPPTRGSIVRPAIVYSVLFGAQGAYLPYIAVFLASTGLDLGTVGALIALFAAVSLVAAPAWGAIADAFGDVRGPVLAAGLLAGSATVLFSIVVGPLGLALAIVLLAAAWAGVIPMVDSRAVRLVGQRDRFGQARAPGSGAFVVVAFATGALIASRGPGGMFLVFGPLVVLTGICGWALLRLPGSATPRGTGPRPRPVVSAIAGRALAGLSPGTILGVLRTPRLGLFFVAAVVVWTSHAALLGFVSLRVLALGGDATAVAATWSLSAVVEVPLMSAFPRFAGRFGAERLIVVGAIAFAIRPLISAVGGAPIALIVASAFGGIGFSFFYIGTVSWIAGAVGRGVQATAQGIFSGTAQAMGAIGGSILGGVIGAALGLPVLFLLSTGGYLLGAFLAWLAIGRSAPGAGTARS
jgi:MFS family permease